MKDDPVCTIDGCILHFEVGRDGEGTDKDARADGMGENTVENS